jgi:hypothetical protein
VYINAASETVFSFTAPTDSAIVGAFRDGIKEKVGAKGLIGKYAEINAELFRDYLRDVMRPRIEDPREDNGTVNEPAILLMNNCSAHTSLEVIVLLSWHWMKTITCPPHTPGICPNAGFRVFGFFKRVKKHLSRNSSLSATEDHPMEMIKVCEVGVSQFNC